MSLLKPRRKPTPLTGRTLRLLRQEGWLAEVVEKQIRFPGMKFPQRRDLWGIADILAAKKDEPPLLVQCTSQSNAGKHVVTICSLTVTRTLLEIGWTIEIFGWAKRGARGKRKTWSASRRRIVLEDLI